MANLDRVIKVDIALNTAGLTTEGFNTIMVVGPHAYTTERVLTLASSPDELLELGFKSTDPIYMAVNDAFSQTPRPSMVKVGRLQCDTIKLQLISATPNVGTEYGLSINSIDAQGELVENKFSYKAVADDNAEAVLTALANSIMASESTSTVYNASVLNNELVIKAVAPTHSFTVHPNSLMTISAFEEAESLDLAANMTLITAADNDFYGIVYTKRGQEDILAMATWTESHVKLYGTAIAEAGAANSEIETDTGSLLKKNNFYRTFWFFHQDAATDFPEAGIMAVCFAVLPGGETWANKRLSGVITQKLTETQYVAVTAKNGNTFEPFRNISITQNGKVAAGEWIDIIRFRDWVKETIQTETFTMMINRDKLPFTDGGIGLVTNTIDKVLALGQKRGGIAPVEFDEDGNRNLGYTISAPLASSISANVKAQRKLTDVKFVARLAGAIHAIEITGSFTYENLIEN